MECSQRISLIAENLKKFDSFLFVTVTRFSLLLCENHVGNCEKKDLSIEGHMKQIEICPFVQGVDVGNIPVKIFALSGGMTFVSDTCDCISLCPKKDLGPDGWKLGSGWEYEDPNPFTSLVMETSALRTIKLHKWYLFGCIHYKFRYCYNLLIETSVIGHQKNQCAR